MTQDRCMNQLTATLCNDADAVTRQNAESKAKHVENFGQQTRKLHDARSVIFAASLYVSN